MLKHLQEMRQRSTCLGFTGLVLAYAMFAAMVVHVPVSIVHAFKIAPAVFGPMNLTLEFGEAILACLAAIPLLIDERRRLE